VFVPLSTCHFFMKGDRDIYEFISKG